MTDSVMSQGQRLIELLTQQRDIYRELRQLADLQRQAIDGENSGHLLRILGDRQRLINHLTEVNTELEPFRSRWDQIRQGIDPAGRQIVGELVEEVQALLKGILELDESDCDALKRRTRSCRDQAAALAVGQRVNAAYAARQYQYAAPRYIDRTAGGEDRR
jgi:hypothetical protein